MADEDKDIWGEFFVESNTEVIPENEEAIEDNENFHDQQDDVVEEDFMQESKLPKLVGSDYPVEFKKMVKRLLISYSTLPKIDYDAIYAELPTLSVDAKPPTTLQLINVKLQKIQGVRSRLYEIMTQVDRCYSFKKRAINIMTDAWAKFADGSSSDKRKADCVFRLSNFYIDLAEVEALFNSCEHIMKNLDSQTGSISRQITVIQNIIKMQEMGRGLGNYDFSHGNLDVLNEAFQSVGEPVEENNEKIEVDETQRIEAQELSFD